MKGGCSIWLISLVFVAVSVQCYDPLGQFIKATRTRSTALNHVSDHEDEILSPVYVQKNQDGLKEADKISSLPGQPPVNFSQYSGYVTVDPVAGRALFYYFAESQDSSTKPLVLWLSGVPGNTSFGTGAMMELGPFRVNPDGKTLWLNKNAWNNVANVIFLDSPAGVGFSYSNTSSDYNIPRDNQTAADSYTFLINWLERFPEHKTRDFYVAGDGYAGHYVPQLARLILKRNKIKNQAHFINLTGIAIGNAYIDFEDQMRGQYEHYWKHALISNKTYQGIVQNCNFSFNFFFGACADYLDEADSSTSKIYPYNIYAPSCSSSSDAPSISTYDLCSINYVEAYLNTPEVQEALHAHVDGAWNSSLDRLGRYWDIAWTVLPTIKELMASGIRVWIYSGDTDSSVSVSSTMYSLSKIAAPEKTPWYPWFVQGEVGGYAVEYKNMTFVTVRGAGLYVPSNQPERALVLFSSFLKGKLPPSY